MLFNITFDSSVNSAPSGFVATVNAVAQFFQSMFTDNVTVNINVGYGEVAGQTVDALGESSTFLNSYSYSQIRSALSGDAKSADDSHGVSALPATSPSSGATYWVARAEAKALGLTGASSSLDGYVGFSNQAGIFDYDRANGITAGQYDFYGVVAHELTEVMGRQLMVGENFNGHANSLEPEDLFHYAGSGVRTFSGTTAGYFSPDGGVTNLDNFNTISGGDFGDWAASAGNDAFLAFGHSGVVAAVTEADLRVMDVIGWDRAAGGGGGGGGGFTTPNPDFDIAYYLAHNPDVAAAGVDPWTHYNQSGWKEGRDPNAWFSTSLYLAANPDVKGAGVNPLDQYHQNGWKEGRDPGPNFDTKLYLVHSPDVAAAGVDPLAHYLNSGHTEGRPIYQAIGVNIVGGFDAEWYEFHNPDIAKAGVDPLQHYMTVGWKEGRNPNPIFDTKGYLAHYADVAAAGVNPLAHYEQSGWKEGRDPSANFDTHGYLTLNPDVAAAHVNPLDHYLISGLYEGRAILNDGLWA